MKTDVDARAAAVIADSTPGRMFAWLLQRVGAAWTGSVARTLVSPGQHRFWLVAAATAATVAVIGRLAGLGL